MLQCMVHTSLPVVVLRYEPSYFSKTTLSFLLNRWNSHLRSTIALCRNSCVVRCGWVDKMSPNHANKCHHVRYDAKIRKHHHHQADSAARKILAISKNPWHHILCWELTWLQGIINSPSSRRSMNLPVPTTAFLPNGFKWKYLTGGIWACLETQRLPDDCVLWMIRPGPVRGMFGPICRCHPHGSSQTRFFTVLTFLRCHGFGAPKLLFPSSSKKAYDDSLLLDWHRCLIWLVEHSDDPKQNPNRNNCLCTPRSWHMTSSSPEPLELFRVTCRHLAQQVPASLRARTGGILRGRALQNSN